MNGEIRDAEGHGFKVTLSKKGEAPAPAPSGQPSILEILEWMESQGITLLPCEPRTKKVMNSISTKTLYGREDIADSFHMPTPERMEVIQRFWSRKDTLQYMGARDVSASMDPEPGWNRGRILGCVDVDTDDLHADALQESAWGDAPVFRGEKGCKIVFFLEPFEGIPAQLQYYREGVKEPQLEVFTRGKHFLIYGEHPHSTPDKPIFYTCIRGFREPIPVLKWIDVRYAVDQIAKKHGLTVHAGKAVNWQDVKKRASNGGSLSDKLNLHVEDFLRPENPVQHGDEIQGAHPVHGSETGMNLAVNPRENSWYCFRCESGGGPLEAYAVSKSLIDCSEAGRGCLQGEKFKRVLDELRKDGYEIPDVKKTDPPILAGRDGTSEPEVQREYNPKLTVNLEDGNFIREYMEYAARLSDAYPEYHHAGAIGLLSLITNRKAICRMSHGVIFSNIWGVCLGASTVSRKTTAIHQAKDIAAELLPSQRLPESFSPEALIEALSDNNHAFLFLDEAASLLAAMQKNYMAEMRDLLCNLYECKPYCRKLRTGQRKAKTEFMILEPYVTLLMATTPENFQNHTDMIDITSGWLVRPLYWYPNYPKAWKPFTPASRELGQQRAGIKKRLDELQKFFSSPLKMGIVTKEQWELEFKLSEDSLQYFQTWQEQRETDLLKESNEAGLQVFGRLATYAIKLAILYTIGGKRFLDEARHGDVTVHIQHMQEAIRQIDQYFMPIELVIMAMVEQGKTDNLQNRIMALLRRHGGKIRKVDVMKRLHVTVRELIEAVDALQQSGELNVYEQKTAEGKKPLTWFYLSNGDNTNEIG